MVLLVDAAARDRFQSQLAEMHRVRKQVFVDRLSWDIPVVGGELEIDQFDTDAAVYLICRDEQTGAHLASTRLLPTTSPYLLGDLFPELCEGGAPHSRSVWEITRFCTTPGLPRDRTISARRKLTVAMIEYALLLGIQRYVCVINVDWLPTMLAIGWSCQPLGEPKTRNGELVGAFGIQMSPTALELARQRWGGSLPVLALPPSARAA